jgi:hypothetical protein
MARKSILALAPLLLLAASAPSAQAWPVRIGIGIGWPCYRPCYAPPVYVAPAPVYVVPAAPPAYVIQNGTPVYVQPVAPSYPPTSPAAQQAVPAVQVASPAPVSQISVVQPSSTAPYPNLPPQPIPVQP